MMTTSVTYKVFVPGQMVLVHGAVGYVEKAKPDDPFDVRVFVSEKGYSSSYAFHNVKST